MNDQQKTLKAEIEEIRKKRSVSPEDFEMMTGITLETAKKLKDGDRIIEKFKLSYTPYTLRLLARIVSGVTRTVDDFLNLLGKKEVGFGGLAGDTELRAKFEFSAYLLLLLDAFAAQHQTYESRIEIFYVASTEVLKDLQQISLEYQESEFNKELYKRMNQYSPFVRQPDTIYEVPPEVGAWNLLQENLTKAVAKGGFRKKELGDREWINLLVGSKRMRDRNKPLDLVSFAYGTICQRAERNYRLMINELFAATEDIRCLSVEDMDKILEEAKAQIARLDEEEEEEEEQV